MKFVEFKGVIINVEQIKLCQKSLDKTKIRNVQNDDSGEIQEVVDGNPFMITLDMGSDTAINFTYATRDERDQNYIRILDILQVQK